jgi:hypothetical protein
MITTLACRLCDNKVSSEFFDEQDIITCSNCWE